MNPYTETWNMAYEIYDKDGYDAMKKFLKIQVEKGKITQPDAEMLMEDMVWAVNDPVG